jgi:predicted patatin/cPLA2 family phospholipase
MLDDGIADSIPVQYALDQGYTNIVVVLTRNKGYRKRDTRMPIARFFYRKYRKDVDKLRELYEEGYEVGKKMTEALD